MPVVLFPLPSSDIVKLRGKPLLFILQSPDSKCTYMVLNLRCTPIISHSFLCSSLLQTHHHVLKDGSSVLCHTSLLYCFNREAGIRQITYLVQILYPQQMCHILLRIISTLLLRTPYRSASRFLKSKQLLLLILQYPVSSNTCRKTLSHLLVSSPLIVHLSPASAFMMGLFYLVTGSLYPPCYETVHCSSPMKAIKVLCEPRNVYVPRFGGPP